MQQVVYWLVGINLSFCVFEFIYGNSIKSIALVGDSIDGFTDSLALILGLLSVFIPLHRKLLYVCTRTFFLDDLFK